MLFFIMHVGLKCRHAITFNEICLAARFPRKCGINTVGSIRKHSRYSFGVVSYQTKILITPDTTSLV